MMYSFSTRRRQAAPMDEFVAHDRQKSRRFNLAAWRLGVSAPWRF
jgi:hypothetical protein